VYQGTASRFVDRGLRNGVEYRYVIASVDRSGNRSAGVAVVAVPLAPLLLSPADRARVRKPPTLTWAPVGRATYYNIQLYRAGKKVLSAWPRKPRLTLAQRWRYGGRVMTLQPGVYRWYVWAGFGARAERRYGPVLGTRTFAKLRQR
jgi:hypothetical protein